MSTLIIKLGAAGDVVRTTPLLHRLKGPVTWITADKNKVFFEEIAGNLRCLSWEERAKALDTAYDLAINLEDSLDAALLLKAANPREIFGAYADTAAQLRYTDNSKAWFGRVKAS